MHRFVTRSIACAALLAAATSALAINGSSWTGGGGFSQRLTLQKLAAVWTIQYLTFLQISSAGIDLGYVAPGSESSLPLTVTPSKFTNSRATVAKTPKQEQRAAIRAKLEELYGLQRIPQTPKKLDVSTLGAVQIDEDSIRTAGAFTAIKNYTKVTGSVTISWSGTLLDGPNAGKTVRGKVKFPFKGDRAE